MQPRPTRKAKISPYLTNNHLLVTAVWQAFNVLILSVIEHAAVGNKKPVCVAVWR